MARDEANRQPAHDEKGKSADEEHRPKVSHSALNLTRFRSALLLLHLRESDRHTDLYPQGFIAQLVIDGDGLFEEAITDVEVPRIQRFPDMPSLSFETLWIIFTLIRHARFSQLYCAIDALDECDPTGLAGLLTKSLNLATNSLLNGTVAKLLFSSRAQPHILSSLDAGEASFRISVQPDICLAMQDDLASIKRLLNLDEEEIQGLQEALLTKSDGMFLWVSLVTKEIITYCYDATYESRKGLIKDLPSGLKGLYEKSCSSYSNPYHQHNSP